MDRAIALANNDVVLLVWGVEERIDGCLGFAVYRREGDGDATPLPAWVGFEGEDNPDWEPDTTERWPIQKFSWRDLTADRGRAYRYEIVPMVGEPGDLAPLEDRRLVTNEVELTPQRSEHVRAWFNRGILSTQALANKLPHDAQGGPSSAELLERIRTPGDDIRLGLAGQIIDALGELPLRARNGGGHCNAALYELSDPELVSFVDDREHLSTVLSNTGPEDETNRDARRRLHENGNDVTDRMLGSGHIGHNKFIVQLDSDGAPQAVMTGSTNWTSTGICGQVNNAIVIESRPLAEAYLDFWTRMKAECPPGERATQSADFRTRNKELSIESIREPREIDGAEVRLCLSPNTKQQSKPSQNPPAPVDMEELFTLIAGARQGILFLLFQPGRPSVLDAILEADIADPDLFVRGAATDPAAIEDYATTLFHRTGERAEVAAAAALDHDFSWWQKELLKASPRSHAIVHDKVLVIDPMSSDCIVVTGSHNLGYRASYANDENMLIVKGHRSLAEAYATHVMDVYDHYRWRWRSRRRRDGDRRFAGLDRTDAWQAKYFGNRVTEAEQRFWLG